MLAIKTAQLFPNSGEALHFLNAVYLNDLSSPEKCTFATGSIAGSVLIQRMKFKWIFFDIFVGKRFFMFIFARI